MMKICHITSAHKSDDVRVFHKECVSLAEAGFDTYLVASGDSREEKGVKVVGVGAPPKKRLERATKFAKKVVKKALELDAEVYHLHDPELLRFVPKLSKKGKKVIFDSHENVADSISDKQYLPKYLRSVIKFFYTRFEKNRLKKCTCVISVTPRICEYLQTVSKKVFQVTNYPRLSPLPEAKNKDKKLFCFAGGVSPQWNHSVVLEALESAGDGDASYRIFGNGSDAYVESLKASKGAGFLDFRGKIDHTLVNGELANSVCGMALCSYSNNTGNKRGTLGNTKLFEYMMAGIPVICTDFDLWKEIVEKHRCGICVPPKDPSAVAEAVKYIISNPDRAAEMGRNGYEAAKELYNWSTQEKILTDIYNSI